MSTVFADRADLARGDLARGDLARLDFGVLIVDDHVLFATSLRMALQARGLAAVQARTDSVDTVLSTANRVSTGLAVVSLEQGADLGGSVADGTALIAALRVAGWQVLAISARAEPRRVAAAVAAGAIGCLATSTSFESLLDVILRAEAGETVLTDAERRDWLRMHSQYPCQEDELTARLDRLSLREREVLSLLAQGYLAADIADKLVIGLSTVRTQIRAILTKLEVNSQIQAVALWSNHLQQRLSTCQCHAGGLVRLGPSLRPALVGRPTQPSRR